MPSKFDKSFMIIMMFFVMLSAMGPSVLGAIDTIYESNLFITYGPICSAGFVVSVGCLMFYIFINLTLAV